MKKFFASIVLIFVLTGVRAQLTKGTWIAGGTGEFFSYSSNWNLPPTTVKGNYTQIDISPSVAYFVVEKLALGIRPTFSSLKGESEAGGITNTQQYKIGPFGRFYFLEADRQFNILTDVSYQYGFIEGNSTGNLSALSLLTGPVVYFNSSVGLEFLLGYRYQKSNAGNQKLTEKGFQMAIGFQIHLEKDN